MDQIDHITKRSDMYVGSLKEKMSVELVCEETKLAYKTIKVSPALSRIFVEILSNAIDNVTRSKTSSNPSSYIKINFDAENGMISIQNDGLVIPIEKNPTTNDYNHSLIFGKLLSGSNYDDEEDRMVSGRNGLGAKLTNVFSKTFEVEGVDPEKKKRLKQVWTNNMKQTNGASIEDSTSKKGYTKVSWIVDFSKFGITEYSSDHLSLFKRYIVDSAVICGSIKIFLNDKLIESNSLPKYANLFVAESNNEVKNENLFLKTEDSTVFLTNNDSGVFEAISFVNGIFTKNGGVHVDAWSEALFRPIVDKYNSRTGKQATCKINISDVKQFFRLFVVSTVIRPEFDGQEKNRLETPSVTPVVKPSQINGILKWKIISKIDDLISAKEMIVLKKASKKTTSHFIDGYDAANNAGGKHSSKCTLIICEGLSAKTYAVAGLTYGIPSSDGKFLEGDAGRDFYGVLPLTGKILNVRNSTLLVTAANKVVSNLIQALGLKYGTDYSAAENLASLNYGRVMLMADGDVDGVHIESLILNLFHHLFPSLMDTEKNFVNSMKTPIARVMLHSKKNLLFYDETRFNLWLKERKEKDYKIKYYKGLGTTKIEDVPDTFGKKMVEFQLDSLASETMNKVFLSSESNARKSWLGNYNESCQSPFSLDEQGQFTQMSITDFIDNEMIKFSHADCARSIANIIDGLKESQRKILFCVKKRNLKFSGPSLKVAQLSGYTAEHSNYHHGEQNLQETIVGMAQDFIGSNNVPLLYRDGQFGSRLDGGNDAASPRYIFTKMDEFTDRIFKADDDCVLDYLFDDGDQVQPRFYAPIIPMILVNGCVGIGTGWSSSIPNFNPSEVVNEVKKWIDNEPSSELRPFYKQFKGSIEEITDSKWTCSGKIDRVKNDVIISELPVGVWTNKYKEFLEDLVVQKKIKSFKNYSTPSSVRFVVSETSNGISCSLNNMKLSTTVSTSNMVLFDAEGKIKRYSQTSEIINEFCVKRLLIYNLRKDFNVSEIQKGLDQLTNKLKFVKAVVGKKIEILDKSILSINNSLEQLDINKDADGSFESLLRISLKNFTLEKIKELEVEINRHKKQLFDLQQTDVKTIWKQELEQLIF